MNISITKYGSDILASERFQQAYGVTHHYKSNVAEHSLHVAGEACRIAGWLNRHGFSISYEDVVRGSLLHDIGMTDSRVAECRPWRKAYAHPRRGTDIAGSEYRENAVVQNTIRRHMWPICVIPPRHISGWIVVAADKICSIREIAA